MNREITPANNVYHRIESLVSRGFVIRVSVGKLKARPTESGLEESRRFKRTTKATSNMYRKASMYKEVRPSQTLRQRAEKDIEGEGGMSL